eukprot:5485503-Prymnesium_polylepis.1
MCPSSECRPNLGRRGGSTEHRGREVSKIGEVSDVSIGTSAARGFSPVRPCLDSREVSIGCRHGMGENRG